MKTTVIGMVVVVAGIGACSGTGPQGTGEPSSSGPVLLEESVPLGMIQRTIVTMNGDGTKTVKTDMITPDEERADEQLRDEFKASAPGDRRPYALTHDTGCADADVWLYNHTVGGTTDCPAVICFINKGSSPDFAALADYGLSYYHDVDGHDGCYSGENWANNVYSYYPGTQDGCLSITAEQDQNTEFFTNFPTNGSEANVEWVSDTSYLILSSSTTSGDESAWCQYEF